MCWKRTPEREHHEHQLGGVCWKRTPEHEHHEQLGGFGRLWARAGSEPPNASIMSSWEALGGAGSEPRTRAS